MNRRNLVAIALVVAIGLAVLANGASVQSRELPRHAQSRVTSLSGSGSANDPIWLWVTTSRDFRICPDGSGAITERIVETRYPTPAEEAQWLASPQEPLSGINESFAPGGLVYLLTGEIRSGVTDPALDTAAPGDSLRRLSSLLAETAPSNEVAEAALARAISLSGVEIEQSNGQTSITGRSRGDQMEVALVFAASPTRLVREAWLSLRTRPGLDLAPPFLMFEREISLSKTDETACSPPSASRNSP